MNSEPQLVHCPHSSACLGCALIDLEYSTQVRHKQDAVERAVRRFPELEQTSLLPAHAASPLRNYRERAKLMIGERGEVGLYTRGTHDVVDIPECQVLSPPLARVANALRSQGAIRGVLHAVDLRNVDNGVLVTFVVDQGTPVERLRSLASDLVTRAPEVVSISINFRQPGSVQVLGNRSLELLGSTTERHHLVPNAPFHYAAHGAFTQVHAGQVAALHAEIERELDATFFGSQKVRVLELYAGSGALALRLAARGAEVTAVESFAPAVQRAQQAAREQQLALRAITEDATTEIENLVRSNTRYDVVIVNPPRRGVTPSVRAAIARLAPRLVLYVSCNPLTLARDLSHLSRLGFAATRATPFDMIPLTDAVEALAVVHPASVFEPKIVYEDDALIAVIKSAHEATVAEAGHRHALSLEERVRLLPNAEHASAFTRLEAGTSGLCLFARDDSARIELVQTLQSRTSSYVTLAKGILRGKGSINRPLRRNKRGKLTTRYKRREVIAGHSLTDVVSERDGIHQIHEHLASIGHPVLGDARFGDPRSNLHFEHRHGLDRPFLHCETMRLEHRGKTLELTAPVSADLECVLQSLRAGTENVDL